MAQVPQVFVLRVVGLPGDLQGHVVGLGVVDLLVPRLDVPDSPGSKNLHLRSKSLDGKLKSYLVVALAGAAVSDGVGALRLGDLHQTLCYDGPGKGGAQKIPFIVGAHHHGGDDHVVHHLIGEILHIELGCAGLDGLFLQAIQLGALSHVAGNGDDLRIIIVFLQPGDDDGGVQSAGVGQHHFFDLFLRHSKCLPYRAIARCNSLWGYCTAFLRVFQGLICIKHKKYTVLFRYYTHIFTNIHIFMNIFSAVRRRPPPARRGIRPRPLPWSQSQGSPGWPRR